MNRYLRLLSWTISHGLINLIHKLQNRVLFDIEASEEFCVGNSSITDSERVATYSSLCGLAATDMEIFRKFRSSRVMVEALDHVTIEQGNSYIREILKRSKWSEEFTTALRKIDAVGKPNKFRFKPYGAFSPTLLRYLKVYLDLQNHFESLNELKIVEIGVGFGGQASLISLLSCPSSYTLYDIPPVLQLAEKFIKSIDVPGNFAFIDGRIPECSNPDIVISNYAFSE